MLHKLMELPYDKHALEPHISAETLEYHHGKHHATYVKKLNELIQRTEHQDQDLETIVRTSRGGVFNNAAQAFNHEFYWKSLDPKGGGQPVGALRDALLAHFGPYQQFQDTFTQAATTLFGSGWVWLVSNDQGQLDILQAQNAGCPLTEGLKPLLCCDVWEHAYYIDYRNARPKYMDAFWNVVNWNFADKKFQS